MSTPAHSKCVLPSSLSLSRDLVNVSYSQETLRYLAFDCLVVDEQNVMSKPLDKRYGRLKLWFYQPYAKMLQEYPQMAPQQPFQ